MDTEFDPREQLPLVSYSEASAGSDRAAADASGIEILILTALKAE